MSEDDHAVVAPEERDEDGGAPALGAGRVGQQVHGQVPGPRIPMGGIGVAIFNCGHRPGFLL